MSFSILAASVLLTVVHPLAVRAFFNEDVASVSKDLTNFRTRTPLDDTGFKRLGPPQEGDWRWDHPEEKPQSVEEYLKGLENKWRPSRRTIYVQPLGGIEAQHARLMETAREYLEAFFGTPAKILPGIEPDRRAWRPKRRQFEAESLLKQLHKNAPTDAFAVAGFLTEDLYTDDDDFVFGLAREDLAAGVFSLARLSERYRGQPKGATLEQRTLTTAVHELGHVLGIDHCLAYQCVMNGSNSLEESDRQPMHLCPVDLQKLRLNIGLDPATRYATLERFYRAHGYIKEARFCSVRKGVP